MHQRKTLVDSLSPWMWIVACLFIPNRAIADENRGYYRDPAIHGENIVFVAEGDLWLTSVNGGRARRLTSHPGDEANPCISPNGKIVAFVASYEGPAEVYTMPINGGQPQRQTVEAELSIPVAWTPGGKLVYATQHFSTLPATQLVTIDLQTNGRTRIPLSQASDATFDNHGTIYFVRPRFHRQEVKRYQGGTARNIWKFEEKASEAKLLTKKLKGESHSPMWAGGRVYFITDRDGTMNIWSMNAKGGGLRQLTHHSGWDVKSASLHKGRIAYRVGADLWLLNIKTGVHQKIPIQLTSDFDQLREKWIVEPMAQLTSAHIGPKGKAVALISRGRLFVAPARQGRMVQITQSPGVRYRDARFMPDGESVLALSDETDEFEFWMIPPRDTTAATQLTKRAKILKWSGIPAPDSNRIAYSDKNEDLWIVDVDSGEQTLVSQNREGISGVVWSPDSRWIVFSQVSVNTYAQLLLYNVEEGTTTALTSDRVNSISPAWSHDGQWVYFLSDRGLSSAVSSPWGPRQPEPYFDKSMKIYRVGMKQDLRSPFQPDDELHKASEDDTQDAKGEESKKDKESRSAEEEDENEDSADENGTDKNGEDEDPKDVQPLTIDLRGIELRVKAIPVGRGNFRQLSATKSTLYWLAKTDDETRLMSLAIGNDAKQPAMVADDVRRYELSADRKKMLIQKNKSLYVVDAPPGTANLEDTRVNLGPWQFLINVREDWHQIFVDAWRLHRDYFYDPNMHGLNWEEVRRKYEPLVKRVTSRAELSDLIGQMVAELSTLHTAVRGGDMRRGEDQISVPTLGARLIRDENAGGYVVDYIYLSDPDYPSELSPLNDPDLNIACGDVIEAINGKPVLSAIDPHLLLREMQDKQVLLKLRKKGADDSSKVIVTPMTGEAALRYRDWEYTRRLQVEEQGKGKIGYVHLRAMGKSNLTEWYRNFYPVFNRQGLIIDVRHNRGGNIDSIILEKLLRKAWFYWKGRVGNPTWNMQYAFRGHMVVLCDEHTASDGEAFAEGFRRLGLGEVIGTRTWGGEIWLSASNRLSDGGIATAAETGVYGPKRKWLIEGHGVDPDIIVDNLPHTTFHGNDAQLDAAIQHLDDLIAEDPRKVPQPPDYPDKAFDYP